MKAQDRGSSLFWLAFSLSVLVESLRLGVGTLHRPGMGFMAFGASGLLAILSLVLFAQASVQKEEGRTEALFAGTRWEKVVLVLAALLLYAKSMPVLGYLLSTFPLMVFLFWILERRRTGIILLSSFLSTLITYYVFSKWLNCQFPDGLFGL